MRRARYAICMLAVVLTSAADVQGRREATNQRLVVKLVFDPVEAPALAMFLDDSLHHSYRVSVGNLLGQADVSSARLSTEDGRQRLVLKLTGAKISGCVKEDRAT